MINSTLCLIVLTILCVALCASVSFAESLVGLHRLQERAEAGDLPAQLQLAAHYAEQETPEGYHRAALWWLKASERGSIEGHFNIGVIFYRGLGREPDPRESFPWFLEAARLGYAPAQLQVGRMYEKGDGVRQSFTEAVRWLLAAAEKGDAEAQVALGLLRMRRGTPVRDSIEAARWLRAAAKQGVVDAQFALADLYWVGLGVPQDRIKALRWYSSAADQGHFEAREKVLGLLDLAERPVPAEKEIAVVDSKEDPAPEEELTVPSSPALFGLPLVGSDLTPWRAVLAQKSWATRMKMSDLIETYDVSKRMNEMCGLALRGEPGGKVEAAEFVFPPYVDVQSLLRIIDLVEREIGPSDQRFGDLTGRQSVQVLWKRGSFRIEVIRGALDLGAPVQILVTAI